mgnify:CR=1 FL=1
MFQHRWLPMLALFGALAACNGKDGDAVKEDVTDTAPAAPAGAIALSDAEMGRVGIGFAAIEAATEIPVATVPATVAPPPNARVAVAATIPGVVTRTLVVEGDSVRQGQPLAVVASRELYTLGAGIERLGRTRQTPVDMAGHIVRSGDVGDKHCEPALEIRRVGGGARTDVEAQHGVIGHHVIGATAVDFRRIYRQAVLRQRL